MEQNLDTIRRLSLKEVIALTSNGRGGEFHVFERNRHVFETREFKPARFDYFNVLLVTSGVFNIKINLVDYCVQKDQLLIIPPGFVHHFQKISTTCQFTGVGFTHKFLGDAGLHKKHIDAFGFFSSQSNPQILLTEQEADNLRKLLLFLKEKEGLPSSYPFKKEIILHAFSLFMLELAVVFKKYNDTGEIKLTRKEDLAMRFMKLLPEHFQEERSVQYYADRLYVTPKHLTKTVKEVIGKTSGELIDEMVIMEAKLLLDNLTLSVANVADYLHFSDQFFFSKFFKKHTGLTPTEYRSGI